MELRGFLVGFAACSVLVAFVSNLPGQPNTLNPMHVQKNRALAVKHASESGHLGENIESTKHRSRGTDAEVTGLVLEEEEAEVFTVVDIEVACMLLGSVTIDVSLFYLFNWPDDDIRLYAWSILSMTISIFVAVLLFSGLNEFIQESLAISNPWVEVGMAYAQCITCMLLMQLSIGYESGMLCEPEVVDLDAKEWTIADATRADHGRTLDDVERSRIRRPDANVSVFEDEVGNEVPVMQRQLILEQRLRRMKCFAGLLAHISGFAAIHAGGKLQHLAFFSASPVMCFIPVLITACVCQGIFVISGKFRSMHLVAAMAKGRKGRRAKMCNEFVQEAENDILAVSASFLIVQVVRYAMSGVLPNEEGVEVPELTFHWMVVAGLLAMSFVFAATSSSLAVSVITLEHQGQEHQHTQHEEKSHKRTNVWAGLTKEDEGVEEHLNHFSKERLLKMVMTTAAMCFAWCFLFAVRWTCVIAPFINLKTMIGMIELALIISMFAGLAVFLLDVVDDHYKSAGASEAGSLAVTTIINALALLVGFSWENCFDRGVTAVSSGTECRNLIKFVMAIVVCFLLVRPWRRFILTKVMWLELRKSQHIQHRFASIKTARTSYSQVPPVSDPRTVSLQRLNMSL